MIMRVSRDIAVIAPEDTPEYVISANKLFNIFSNKRLREEFLDMIGRDSVSIADYNDDFISNGERFIYSKENNYLSKIAILKNLDKNRGGYVV